MKTRQIVIAAAVGLLSASPVWAAGSYEGSLWTDLIAQREQSSGQPATLADFMMRERVFEGDLFQRLTNAHRNRSAAEGQGTAMAGDLEQGPLNRLDLRPYVSIFEQLAMRPGGDGRS